MSLSGWDPGVNSQPLPPMNGQVLSAYQPGILDIRWDDPSLLAGNSAYWIVGVNVYRSDVSDRGPYHRVNDLPVGGTFFRDRTDNVLISKEVVDWNRSWVYRGDAPNSREWKFKTQNPIVQQYPIGPFQTPTSANTPTDVILYIDDVPVTVDTVFGPTGEVTLINLPIFDDATEKFVGPVLPTANSKVEVTYWTNRNHVRSGLDANLFYRLTTVVLDPTQASGYLETDLSYCPPLMLAATETLDYIWREAVRRNQWILEQGGERVKVFIRRQSGIRCFCQQDPRLNEYNKQPSSRCEICFGTGFVGGYEGPYETIIAPDDYERKISQAERGRRKEHTGETWCGPTPLLTQRDFLVKQTNERYSVGPVRRPTNRGVVVQQHFNIAYLDEQDIRYKVPINGTSQLPWPQTRYSAQVDPPVPVDGSIPVLPVEPPYPVGPDQTTPMETDHSGTSPENEVRGRTPVWQNIQR